jgi:hypothetical protein
MLGEISMAAQDIRDHLDANVASAILGFSEANPFGGQSQSATSFNNTTTPPVSQSSTIQNQAASAANNTATPGLTSNGSVSNSPALQTPPPGSPAPNVRVGQYVVASGYKNAVKRAARDMRNEAIEQWALLRQRTNAPELLATILAVDGLDLRDVAVTYYGTPTDWHGIAAFNGLTSSKLVRGQQVHIPKLTTSTNGSA